MNIWENIKNRLTVDEVISSYIPIQSNGSNYRCVCPFHKEKSPSLIISPQKGIWHCFGCGQGGDIFRFVEEYEHISKSDALQILAKKAGVELEQKDIVKTSPEQTNRQDSGLKYLTFGADTYHKILLKLLQDKTNRITQYCLSRGLTPQIIEQFQIGYAPTGNFLLKLSQKHGLDLNLLLEVGILRKDDGKDLKDKFTDRLILPIWNKIGQVIGFTGRSIPPDKVERPKYLNSPQSIWFNKSQIWYGWHLARPYILQEKKVIVVEGNMDVVASFSAGLSYTMASQGTSFTEAQIKMLSTVTKTIWLAFDNDEAGKLSSDKFFKIATLYGLSVQKVLIPESFKDLDEFLKSEPNIKLQASPYLDYILKEKHSQLANSNPDIQKIAILSALDLISALDAISREQYLIKLNQISGLSVTALSSQLTLAINNVTTQPAEPAREIIENKDKTILVSWQNLIATSYQGNYGKGLQSLYLLLKYIFPLELFESNLEEYIIRSQEEFELIKENLQNNPEIPRLWAESITSFIDNKTVQFFQNPDLQDYYLTWKQKGLN